ncbi:nucleotidyltransferase family protein [Mangrovibacterium sp.]|uniref:nucleotidyltransferase family protein n=1 Tax=Mangrovibacterium sp. TaxID=1961364 RepID=UPI003564AF9A
MKAMLFAAGLGTRLKPLTDTKPKALVEIGGMTLLERCIRQLEQNGIREIIINVHHFADQISSFLKERENFGLNIQISDESNELLDTGGGLLKAKELLLGEEPILLINVDILTNLDFKALFKAHQKSHSIATLVVRNRETSRYLLFNGNVLAGWKNKKNGELRISRLELLDDAEEFAFSGIHIIEAQLLNLINESGKFSIIDLYLRLAKTHKIGAYIDERSAWMDLGKVADLGQAEALIRQLNA